MLRSARVLWTVGAFIAAAWLAWAGSSLPSGLIAEAETLRALETAESLRQAALKYEEALPLWRRLGKTSEEAGTLHQLGLVYHSLGDGSSARNAFLEALRLRRTLRDRRGESASLTALASVIEQLGELDRALRYLRQSLRLSRSIGDQLGEARALYHMGCIHDKVPKSRCVGYSCRLQALACLREALVLFQRAGDLRGQGDALSRAAMNYEGIGDRKKALESLEEALDLHRRAVDRRGEARVFYNLGYLCLWSRAYSQALDNFQQALELRRYVGDRAGEIVTVMAMGRAAHGLGRLPEALRYFEISVEMVEAERRKLTDPDLRTSYFSTKENYYGHYIDALMDLHQSEPSGGYAARALEASERVKARTLVEVLGDPNPEAPFGVDQIRRQVLDDDTLLLEYAMGVADLYVWVLSRTHVSGFRLGDPNRIRAAVLRWRDLLHRSRDDPSAGRACDRAGAELSGLLLGPVGRLLSRKRLLIVMDAWWQDLPLAALPKPGADAAPLASENEVVGLPSARTLCVMRRVVASRALPPKSVAVLADPVFDRHDPRVDGSNLSPPGSVPKLREGTNRLLPRLPFSRKEATAIVSFASPEESLLALDFAASRQTATSPRLGQYKIVHFATHALVDPVRAENSRLALSLVDQAGTPQNGFLGLRDIYNLRLPVELVVLSACQTGLGKDVRGEGIIGLSRGFLAAGARRVLVSLWKIDDEATAEFMRQFYRAMLTGERLAPAAALRAAQAAMWNNPRWRSPFYWSGFVLQGDWR